MIELEAALQSMPVEQWITRQAVVFDWFDGPRQGVGALAAPTCEFFFELLDERPTEDGLDDRLFRLSALPAGSVAEIVTTLHELGAPAGPVWVPVWRFPSEAARQQADQFVANLLMQRRPSTIVVHTRDLLHFLGYWRLDRNGSSVTDWFANLHVD
jgi:hypothetical protein